MQEKEATLNQAIEGLLRILESNGKLQWIRNNSGALPVDVANAGNPSGPSRRRRYVRFGRRGSPDWIVMFGGTCLQVEAKAPRGRQSISQKAWQAKAERCGNHYHIVRSPDEMVCLLRSHGLLD